MVNLLGYQFSDTAALIGIAVSILGVQKLYNGGIEGLIADLTNQVRGQPAPEEMRRVFNPSPDQQVENSLIGMQNELFAEELRRSPTDIRLLSHHYAREDLKELGKVGSMITRKGGDQK